MSYKIGIIIPWFGTLPSTYQMWRTSVLSNKSVDFYLFTDQQIESEGNLAVINTSFDDFVEDIQKIFPFPISCSFPYKLCDYKPAYGEAFKDIFSSYDFWGYCDMDMVFGDIRKFITDDILDENDKIFIEAHLSLYKNNERMNGLFRECGNYPEYNYDEVYKTDRACFFDEYRGMELKCIRKGVQVYNDGRIRESYDPKCEKFYREDSQVIVRWVNGSLYEYGVNGTKNELVYAHVCRRKMQNMISDENRDFVVLPGKIQPYKSDEAPSYFNVASGMRGGINYIGA